MPSLLPRSFPRYPFALGALALGAILVVLPAWGQDPALGQPTQSAQSPTAWTTYKGNYQRTGSSNAAVTLPLSLQWRFSSEGPQKPYVMSPLVLGAPGNQRIVFGAGKYVYALDSQTGQQLWRSSELESEIGTPLTLFQSDAGDFLLTALDNGRVVAITAANGQVKWTADTKSRVADAGPLVVSTDAGPRILIAVSNGQIVAIDPSGAIDTNWTLSLDRFGAVPSSSMALSPDGTKLFVLVSDGRLFEVDVASRKVLFPIRLSGRAFAAPVVTSDSIISVIGARVQSNTVDLGRSEWAYTAKGDIGGSPAVGPDNTVYCGTKNGFFQALDTDGKVKWQTQIKEASFTGAPAIFGNTVLVGTSTGLMVGFDTQTGAITWENLLDTTRTTLSQGQNARGRFGGFGGFGGRGQTTTAQPNAISSAPAIINGQVFVFADNGALYSFTSDAIDADTPRVTTPKLTLNGQGGRQVSIDLRPNSPSVIPGSGPLSFSAQLDDMGSGVDPSTIAVTVDNKAIDSDRLNFDPTKGKLDVTLIDTKKGDQSLDEGLKNVVVKLRDYAGNETTFQISFLVDKDAQPPNGNQGGFGGFPGGGFPGGGFPGGGFPGGGFPGGGFPGGDGGGFPGGGFPGGGFPGFPGQ